MSPARGRLHLSTFDFDLRAEYYMAIELVPLPLPASADPSKFVDFGREVKGVNPGSLSPELFEEVKDALYKVIFISY